MAVTNIPIDRTKTYGQQLSNLMNAWQQVITLHDFIRSKMISCGYSDSSATDGSTFGLGTTVLANAAFVQIDTVTTDALSGATLAAIKQMIQQVG